MGKFDGATVLNEAVEALERGDYEVALEAVRALYGQELPSAIRGGALAIEVGCLEFLNLQEEAQELIQEVMKDEGDDLNYVAAAAFTFEQVSALHHAEVFFQNLVRLDPENPEVRCRLAALYANSGRIEDAIEVYGEAVERCPEWADAFLGKGMMLSLMGENDEARELILRAVDLDGENFTSWCALAQLEWSVENFEVAEQAYTRALNCPEADLMAIHFEWGTSAAFAGDGTRAKSCAEAMQQIDPEDWRTLMTTGGYHYTDGDYDAAETSFEEAFEMALTSREHFALESSVAILFDFLTDTGREIETDRYMDRIFEEQVFTENVLQILLSQEGLTSSAAVSHQVVLRSPSEPPAYRVYAVSAESPEQSEFFAQRFERRCDESVWNVHDIQQVSEPSQALLGVYWRSEAMPEPPPMTETLPE